MVEFLLEECFQIDKPDLKVELFTNVASFLKEWILNPNSGDLQVPERTFECLSHLLKIFDNVTPSVLLDMVNVFIEDADQVDGCFMDEIDTAEKTKRKKLLIDLMISNLAAVMKCHRMMVLKPLKEPLLRLLSQVFVQSNSIWNECLKFEEEYNAISSIKE